MTNHKSCIFCRKRLHSAIKAKEHVLRKSWLDALKLLKVGITSNTHNKDGFLNQRKFAAQAVLTGEICKSCNNGWMDSLDRRVEKIILGYASTPVPIIKISSEDSFYIARWVLKVACAYEASDHVSRRHIPEEVLSQMHKEDYLPEGFIAFAAPYPFETHAVGVGIYDFWSQYSKSILTSMSQSTRLKFVVGYNSLIIGCAYVLNKNPLFVGISGVHQLIYANKATLSLSTDIQALAHIVYPENVLGTPLDIAALTLDVRL